MEPLAWNIENEPLMNQAQSPLFQLPRELRDLVFEYALTDCKLDSWENKLRRNESRFKFKPMNLLYHDIAIDLLRTCRAVYFETWTLPLSLNPYVIYDLHGPRRSGMSLDRILPWQLALVGSLDITISQTALEGNTLLNYLHRNKTWQASERHKGVYFAPRCYKTTRRVHAMSEYTSSFNFAILPADKSAPRHFLSHVLGTHDLYPGDAEPPWSSAMRVMMAKPLTSLTLRLQHTDWWTWTDHPDSLDRRHYLGLDPSVGDGSAEPGRRPTATSMQLLASQRRDSNLHPNPPLETGWLQTIAALPDLQQLELVLETFKEKEKQLDVVVDCAKTWVFPITGEKWELVWDGKVGMSSWSIEMGKEKGTKWFDKASVFVVRRMRFVRRRVVVG